MSEQTKQGKVYLETKQLGKVKAAMIINLIKLVAVLGLVCRGMIGYGQSSVDWDPTEPVGRILEIVSKPYVAIPLFAASVVLTLLWTKSRAVITIHGIAYFCLGLFFYQANWLSIIDGNAFTDVSFLLAGPILAYVLWGVTLIQFLLAWEGSKKIKVEEVEGMRSIFPEQR